MGCVAGMSCLFSQIVLTLRKIVSHIHIVSVIRTVCITQKQKAKLRCMAVDKVDDKVQKNVVFPVTGSKNWIGHITRNTTYFFN